MTLGMLSVSAADNLVLASGWANGTESSGKSLRFEKRARLADPANSLGHGDLCSVIMLYASYH